MSATPADFAVIGSSPLARLLAGLLASAHGRKVIFVGESQAGYRLPRNFDLSVAPATRPETWALLGEGVSDTRKLLSRIAGRGVISRVDPIFFASNPRAIEALSHIRHMASGFRVATEPVASSTIGPDRSGIVLRDALSINRPVLEVALDAWLEKHGVLRLTPDRLFVAPDGSSVLTVGGQDQAAEQTILADDEAIQAHLPPRQWPALLRRQEMATILTTPMKPMAASIMLDIGSGATMLRQPEAGLAAIGPGDLAAFSGFLQSLLGNERQVEQAGQTAFIALATADGAPAVGRVGGSGADVVAGLGISGVFLAPALASWLAGTAPQHQANWFAARLVDRGPKSADVTEFSSMQQGAAA